MVGVQKISAFNSSYKYARVNMNSELYSKRRAEILAMVKQGLNRKAIREKLGIGHNTLTYHWKNLKIDDAIIEELKEVVKPKNTGVVVDNSYEWEPKAYCKLLIKYGIPVTDEMKKAKEGKFAKQRAEILSLLKQGLNRGEIAKKMGFSRYDKVNKMWEVLDIENAIKDDLLKSRLQGKTKEEIKKEWNWDNQRYYIMLTKYRIPVGKKDMLFLQEDKIIELKNQGKTKQEIADLLGVSLRTLNSVMNDLGINSLNKEKIQSMKKSNLIALLKQYGSVWKASQAIKMSYPTLMNLYKFFGLK